MERIRSRNIHKRPFDIQKAALLVIDMQRYFLEESKHGHTPAAEAVIPNIQRLISIFRDSKRPVIFTRHAHNKDGSDLGILKEWWDEMPVDGTPEAEIDPQLKPLSNETVLTKNRYSAFYNTDLDKILRTKSVKEVVITGVMTNICCESTARDAFFRDYFVRFVADGTGSIKEEMHVATLLNLAYAFADICTTDELVDQVSRSAG